MSALSDIQRALVQLLAARGAVSDDELREVIGFLRSDFPACDIGHDAPVVFGGLNQRLRQVSLEVKSVVHVAENADGGVERTLFHCLVNNAEDVAAVENGSYFSALELQFVRDIIQSLVVEKKLSISSLYMLKPKKLNELEAKTFVKRLLHEKWLLRNDRLFYQIGHRSQVELRSFIEMCVRGGRPADDNTDVDPATLAKELDELSQLPQILFY